MARPRVLVEPNIFADREQDELFKDIADVVSLRTNTRAEILAALQPGGACYGVVGFVRSASSLVIGRLDAEMLDAMAAAGVKYIASQGAGYDMIDLNACKKHGGRPSTATTALYLIISAMRMFSKAERDMRAGKWRSGHSTRAAHDLEGHTLAILGMGGIGLRLAHLARPFEMKIIYHNRRPKKDAPEWVEYFGPERLDEFFARADVLSAHVPLNEKTEGYIGEEVIRKMRRGSVLVNTARGGVVDEAALIRALEDGHLGAVGLDVFPDEPQVNPQLVGFPNATLLPHLSCFSYETVKAVEVRAMENLRDMVVIWTSANVVPELQS